MDPKLAMTNDDALVLVTNWASKRPRWYSAALLAIVAGEIDEDEVKRLAALAISVYGGDVSQPFVTLTELRGSSSALPTVNLHKIQNVENVNRLASDGGLEFAPRGLSVVYGPNGSGKSGYTRILKQVCRVRGGALPILPNVYSASKLTSRAEIEWSCDGKVAVEAWSPSAISAAELKHVNIFDSAAAASATKDAAVAPFVPYPVRLVEGLGNLIVRVRDELVARAQMLEGLYPKIPGLREESLLTPKVALLGSKLGVVEFIQSIALSSDEIAERDALLEQAKHLAELNLVEETIWLDRRLTEVGKVVEAVRMRGALLDSQAIDASRAAAVDMGDAIASAEASAQLLEGNSLEGIGADQWKSMWENARKYSNEMAYPDHIFPHVEGDSICVLCEQPFSEAAAQRMTNLEAFVADSSQANLDKAKQAHAEWVKTVSAAADASIFKYTDELLELATQLEIDLTRVSDAALVAADELLHKHKVARSGDGAALEEVENQIDQASGLEWASNELDTALVTLENVLNLRKSTLVDSQDLEKQKVDAARLADLNERMFVSGATTEITKHYKIARALLGIYGARDTCKTNSTTELSGKLSDGLITAALGSALTEELEALGADRLQVFVHKGTAKAASTFKLKLSAGGGDPIVGDVLSEGELRVLGLSAFLMETRMTGGSSTIVFDDPVSSLDHVFREKVAKRIAAEAEARQVVVFTHDLVFLDELAEAGRLLGSQPAIAAIKFTSAGSGVGSIDLPAAGGSFDIQLKHIEKSISDSKTIWDENDDDVWEPVSRRIASDLRIAWERGVEEVLLSKVVSRFRSSVQTTRLREVQVEDEVWREVESAMTELSGKGPHDSASGKQSSPYSHKELVAQLARLRAWKTTVGVSRKTTTSRREALIPRA